MFQARDRLSHMKSWDAANDEKLASLARAGVSVPDMAKLLERTQGSISSRCLRLGLSRKRARRNSLVDEFS